MEEVKYCKCGCEGKIIYKTHHKYVGLPNFIKGHYFKGKNHTELAKQKISISNKKKDHKYWLGKKRDKETIIKLHKGLKDYIEKHGHPALNTKRTEEQRKKMSISRKGRKFTEEQKKNMFHQGMKGKRHSAKTRQKMKENHVGTSGKHWKLTINQKKHLSEAFKGKIIGIEQRKKQSLTMKGRKPKNIVAGWNKGKKLSEEHRKKLSLAHIGLQIGEKAPNWQGGISFEPYSIEFNNKFKRLVRKRDNQICMICSIHREKLNRALDVHHINYDKKLTISENCISLCQKCHLKTNYNRKYWVVFCQNLLTDKYGYKYSEDKNIILEVEEWKKQ